MMQALLPYALMGLGQGLVQGNRPQVVGPGRSNFPSPLASGMAGISSGMTQGLDFMKFEQEMEKAEEERERKAKLAQQITSFIGQAPGEGVGGASGGMSGGGMGGLALSPMQQKAALLMAQDDPAGVAKMLFNWSPPKRKIVKGADGFNYYADTKERVLPDAVRAPDKPPTGYNRGESGLEIDPGYLAGQEQLAEAKRPPERPYRVGNQLVSPETLEPIYTAPTTPPKPPFGWGPTGPTPEYLEGAKAVAEAKRPPQAASTATYRFPDGRVETINLRDPGAVSRITQPGVEKITRTVQEPGLTRSQTGQAQVRVAALDQAITSMEQLYQFVSEGTPTGASQEIQSALQGTVDQLLTLGETVPFAGKLAEQLRQAQSAVLASQVGATDDQERAELAQIASSLADPTIPALEALEWSSAVALAAALYPTSQRIPVEIIKQARSLVETGGVFGPGRETAKGRLYQALDIMKRQRNALGGQAGVAPLASSAPPTSPLPAAAPKSEEDRKRDLKQKWGLD